MVEARAEVRPRWPLRLPGGGADGVLRRRGGRVERLLHVDDAPAIVRVAQPAADAVVLTAAADRTDVAREALARMRFALTVDDDLRPFYEKFRFDALIGRSVRSRPQLRVIRRPEPFEALVWAITEQLIEFQHAAAIQRRIVHRLGRRCRTTGLRDLPTAATLAATSPALLESLGLSGGRALTLRRAAREVASGRADPTDADHERAWRRLRAISGIGSWTVEMMAIQGQGRYDQVPANDVGLLKLVGHLQTGVPRARATEQQVRERFAVYGEWAGLAAAHALGVGAQGLATAA
jgi:3-methyladenine DNA glycosylase/8-oxoguanine DNA glycosylase